MNKLLLNHKEIINGLKFYDINDNTYLQKCLDCCDYLLNNKQAKIEFETIYNLLYNNLQSSYRSILKKKSKQELFGENYHLFTTNLVLLLGYSIHKKNIVKYKLDNKQIQIQKIRIKQALTNDIYIKNLEDIRISQMLWGIYIINIKIIEVGRLQYEHYKDSINEYIKIHIPSGSKMIYEDILLSLKESKQYIGNYFNINSNDYYCNSWLLSKQISQLIKSDSNIYKFQTLFDIEEGEECIKDILNFVFGRTTKVDYHLLEEITSLQKNIKYYLLNGNTIKIGIGKLKEVYL